MITIGVCHAIRTREFKKCFNFERAVLHMMARHTCPQTFTPRACLRTKLATAGRCHCHLPWETWPDSKVNIRPEAKRVYVTGHTRGHAHVVNTHTCMYTPIQYTVHKHKQTCIRHTYMYTYVTIYTHTRTHTHTHTHTHTPIRSP